MGTALVILFELIFGKYLNAKGAWDNSYWVECLFAILMIVGSVIEMERLGFFKSIPKNHNRKKK